MATLQKVWRLIAGAPLDPLDPRTRHAIAVVPIRKLRQLSDIDYR
ncbi:hypothetical protein [Paraburkholderia flagellata]|nr:hypothetical protein [Paraburkholderia flagellata]